MFFLTKVVIFQTTISFLDITYWFLFVIYTASFRLTFYTWIRTPFISDLYVFYLRCKLVFCYISQYLLSHTNISRWEHVILGLNKHLFYQPNTVLTLLWQCRFFVKVVLYRIHKSSPNLFSLILKSIFLDASLKIKKMQTQIVLPAVNIYVYFVH